MPPEIRKPKLIGAEEKSGLLFLTPWLIGLAVFGIYPIVASVYFSFSAYNVVKPPVFVGLENYRILLFDDPLFWKSLWNTAFLLIFGLPLQLATALLLAVLLNEEVRGTNIFRAIFYLPVVMPTVAVAFLWLFLLNPRFGIINGALSLIGIDGPGWMTSPLWSKPGLILMSMWGVGGTMVIFLAGLKQIPPVLYEAARIDGAGPLQRFTNVTLPMLSPVIFFNLVMGIIGSFQFFTHVYVMTADPVRGGGGAGGPEFSTLVYPLYLYQNAFVYFQMGYASAMAWLLFLIIAALLVVVFRTSGWVYYESR